jgi:hypothetical protein
MPGACYFWFMAAVPLLLSGFSENESEKILIPWVLAFLLMGSWILFIAEKNPYRQNQPLAQQSGVLRLAGSKIGLKVEKERAQYFNSLFSEGFKAGLNSKSYIIDLTGASQGVSLVLDLVPLGSPWMPGGYPGSFEVAKFLLKDTNPQNLRESWILVSPDSPRGLDVKILESLNLRFPESYELAFSVVLPSGKNYPLAPIRQDFFRPKKADSNCTSPLFPNDQRRKN